MSKNQPHQTIPILILILILIGIFLTELLFYKAALPDTLPALVLALVFLCALLFGRYLGLLAGLLLGLAGSLFKLQAGSAAWPLSADHLLDLLRFPALLYWIFMPVIGYLTGSYIAISELKLKKNEKHLLQLRSENKELHLQVNHYDQEFHSLSQRKIFRNSWDNVLDGNEGCEPIVGLLIATVLQNGRNRQQNDLLKYDFNATNRSIQRFFDLVVRIRPEILAVMHLDGTMIIYQEVLMALFGHTAKYPIIGRKIQDFLLPEDAARASENMMQAVKRTMNPDVFYGMQSAAGPFTRLLISPSITLSCLGNPLVLIACVWPHSSVSLVEENQEPKQDPPGLADLISMPVWCLAADRETTYISPSVAKMLDDESGLILGQKIDRFISRKYHSFFEAFIQACQDGRSRFLDLVMQTHAGRRIVFSIRAYPTLGENGRYLGAVLLIEDITALKKVEEALQHRLAMEKMISAISTRFVAVPAENMDQEITQVLQKVNDFEEALECFVEIDRSNKIRKAAKYHVNQTRRVQDMQPISSLAASSGATQYETVDIPIVIESESLGHFRFFQAKYRSSWLDMDLELIRLIGEIMINALIRKENELSIKVNENRLLTTLQSIGDAVIATNMAGQVIMMNRRAEILTGWSAEAALKQPLDDVFRIDWISAAKTQTGTDMYTMHPLSETDDSIILKARDGKQYDISVTRSQIEASKNEIYGEVIVFRDVTQKKRENDEIRYASYHDELTGLYNRAFFEEELSRLNTPRQYPITLILGDCNGLKIANDIFGHLEGDRLLKTIASILRTATRREDIAARWGGDEFGIILPQTDEQVAGIIRERILHLCATSDMVPIQPSLAIGSATNTDNSSDLEGLLKLAEDRMYRHKLMEGKSARNAILRSIEKMIYEKSYETEEHASRMVEISGKIGRAIGMADYELEELSQLAVLHDMGKIGIPDSILLKADKLNDEEWAIMKKHPEKGYKIAKSTPELSNIADSILHHHEHWDGSGYPDGLRGDSIPKLSRILAIVDAYDVITHSHTYKEAQSCEAALQEIAKCAGTQFDPDLARLFIDVIRSGKSADTGADAAK